MASTVNSDGSVTVSTVDASGNYQVVKTIPASNVKSADMPSGGSPPSISNDNPKSTPEPKTPEQLRYENLQQMAVNDPNFARTADYQAATGKLEASGRVSTIGIEKPGDMSPFAQVEAQQGPYYQGRQAAVAWGKSQGLEFTGEGTAQAGVGFSPAAPPAGDAAFGYSPTGQTVNINGVTYDYLGKVYSATEGGDVDLIGRKTSGSNGQYITRKLYDSGTAGASIGESIGLGYIKEEVVYDDKGKGKATGDVSWGAATPAQKKAITSKLAMSGYETSESNGELVFTKKDFGLSAPGTNAVPSIGAASDMAGIGSNPNLFRTNASGISTPSAGTQYQTPVASGGGSRGMFTTTKAYDPITGNYTLSTIGKPGGAIPSEAGLTQVVTPDYTTIDAKTGLPRNLTQSEYDANVRAGKYDYIQEGGMSKTTGDISYVNKSAMQRNREINQRAQQTQYAQEAALANDISYTGGFMTQEGKITAFPSVTRTPTISAPAAVAEKTQTGNFQIVSAVLGAAETAVWWPIISSVATGQTAYQTAGDIAGGKDIVSTIGLVPSRFVSNVMTNPVASESAKRVNVAIAGEKQNDNPRAETIMFPDVENIATPVVLATNPVLGVIAAGYKTVTEGGAASITTPGEYVSNLASTGERFVKNVSEPYMQIATGVPITTAWDVGGKVVSNVNKEGQYRVSQGGTFIEGETEYILGQGAVLAADTVVTQMTRLNVAKGAAEFAFDLMGKPAAEVLGKTAFELTKSAGSSSYVFTGWLPESMKGVKEGAAVTFGAINIGSATYNIITGDKAYSNYKTTGEAPTALDVISEYGGGQLDVAGKYLRYTVGNSKNNAERADVLVSATAWNLPYYGMQGVQSTLRAGTEGLSGKASQAVELTYRGMNLLATGVMTYKGISGVAQERGEGEIVDFLGMKGVKVWSPGTNTSILTIARGTGRGQAEVTADIEWEKLSSDQLWEQSGLYKGRQLAVGENIASGKIKGEVYEDLWSGIPGIKPEVAAARGIKPDAGIFTKAAQTPGAMYKEFKAVGGLAGDIDIDIGKPKQSDTFRTSDTGGPYTMKSNVKVEVDASGKPLKPAGPETRPTFRTVVPKYAQTSLSADTTPAPSFDMTSDTRLMPMKNRAMTSERIGQTDVTYKIVDVDTASKGIKQPVITRTPVNADATGMYKSFSTTGVTRPLALGKSTIDMSASGAAKYQMPDYAGAAMGVSKPDISQKGIQFVFSASSKEKGISYPMKASEETIPVKDTVFREEAFEKMFGKESQSQKEDMKPDMTMRANIKMDEKMNIRPSDDTSPFVTGPTKLDFDYGRQDIDITERTDVGRDTFKPDEDTGGKDDIAPPKIETKIDLGPPVFLPGAIAAALGGGQGSGGTAVSRMTRMSGSVLDMLSVEFGAPNVLGRNRGPTTAQFSIVSSSAMGGTRRSGTKREHQSTGNPVGRPPLPASVKEARAKAAEAEKAQRRMEKAQREANSNAPKVAAMAMGINKKSR